MAVPFSGAGVYVTVGGFLVEFNTDRSTKKEFSPGTNAIGQTIYEAGLGRGWTWHQDGTISLEGSWSAKLRLSQKLDFPSIPIPPEGYRYKDGYPKLVKVPAGQECMTPKKGALVQFTFDTDGEYIPLEKILKENKCEFSGPGVYLTVGGYLVQLDGSGRSTPETSVGTFKNNTNTGNGWLWYADGTILLDSPWDKLLRLKEKLKVSSIPKPSEGFEYENGYPQYRKIKKGEIGLTMFGSIFTEDTKETSELYIPLKEKTVWYDITDPDYIIQHGDQYQTKTNPYWAGFDLSIGKKLMDSAPYESIGFKARSKIEPVKYYEITDPNYRVRAGDFFLANSVKGEKWLMCGTSLEGSTLDSLKTRGIEKVKSVHPHIPIIIDGPGVYETSGGYLVELNDRKISRTPVPCGDGSFVWEYDGRIYGIEPAWIEKLRIVGIIRYSDTIPEPPEGYQYAGGYPQYRHIEPNEWFMRIGTIATGNLDQNGGKQKLPVKAIPLEKIEPKYYECDRPDPNYVIRKGDQYFTCGKWHDCDYCVESTVDKAFNPILKMRSLSPFPQKEEIWYTVTNPDYIFVEGDEYQHNSDKLWSSIVNSVGKTMQQAGFDEASWRCRSRNKEACLIRGTKEYTKINANKLSIALKESPNLLIKPSLLKRGFNYWVVEPVSNAFRYVVITAVLWGGVEIYKNPAVVWKFLPKISVSINK